MRVILSLSGRTAPKFDHYRDAWHIFGERQRRGKLRLYEDICATDGLRALRLEGAET
jgi:hypothetical protein